MRWFIPDYYVRNFEHVDIERLKKQGIKLLLCDIDNTLITYDEDEPNENVVAFIDKIQASGIIVAICSNATKKRATRFSKELHVSNTYYMSMKPLPFRFKRAIDEYQLRPDEIALIGDQMYTDILGGNLAGLYTILTAPLNKIDRGVTKFNRRFEWFVYHYLERKHILRKGEFDD